MSAELNGLVSGISVVSPTCLSATVDPSKILEVAHKLDSMGFDHVKSVTAVDLPQETKIDIVYHISSFLNAELV